MELKYEHAYKKRTCSGVQSSRIASRAEIDPLGEAVLVWERVPAFLAGIYSGIFVIGESV